MEERRFSQLTVLGFQEHGTSFCSALMKALWQMVPQ